MLDDESARILASLDLTRQRMDDKLDSLDMIVKNWKVYAFICFLILQPLAKGENIKLDDIKAILSTVKEGK